MRVRAYTGRLLLVVLTAGCAVFESEIDAGPPRHHHLVMRVQDSASTACAISSGLAVHRLQCDDCPLDWYADVAAYWSGISAYGR